MKKLLLTLLLVPFSFALYRGGKIMVSSLLYPGGQAAVYQALPAAVVEAVNDPTASTSAATNPASPILTQNGVNEAALKQGIESDLFSYIGSLPTSSAAVQSASPAELSSLKAELVTYINGRVSQQSDSLAKSFSAALSNIPTPVIPPAFNISSVTTDNLAQGSINKYYSSSLFNTDFALKTTDNLSQGTTNRYYNTTLFNADLAAKSTDNLAQGVVNLYFTQGHFDAALAATTTLNNLTTLKGITNLTFPSLATPSGTFLATDASGMVIATSSPANYWTLSGSNLFNNSGTKVGIGTTTPNNSLDIYNTTKPAIGFGASSDSTNHWTVGIDTSDANKFKISSSTDVNSNPRLTIDGNGNVGIGTTAPNALAATNATVLTLNNPTINANATTSAIMEFAFQDSVRLHTGAIRFVDVGNATGSGEFIFSVPTSFPDGDVHQDLLSLTGRTGSVGIGTTDPIAKFQVVGGLSFFSGSQAGVMIGDGGGYGLISAITKTESGAEPLVLQSFFGGNVGIGQTNPQQKLDVSGTIRQTGATNCALSTNSSGDIICTSDQNLKQGITPYAGGLAVIEGINPSYFQYKGETYTRVGFIAQNVQTVLPEATPLQANGYLGLDSNAVLAASVNAIKELDIKVNALASSTQTVSDESGFLSDLENLGVVIGQGVAHFGQIVADRITATHAAFDDIELKDSDTGAVYCVRIKSGVLAQSLGGCDTQSSGSSSGSSSSGSQLSGSAPSTGSEQDASSTPPDDLNATSTPPADNGDASSTPPADGDASSTQSQG